MLKFRKKPIVIEAIQWNGANEIQIMDFIGKKLNVSKLEFPVLIVIPTLEGNMTATQGDWIIKGVNGEFYPCKPDIFEKTYEQII